MRSFTNAKTASIEICLRSRIRGQSAPVWAASQLQPSAVMVGLGFLVRLRNFGNFVGGLLGFTALLVLEFTGEAFPLGLLQVPPGVNAVERDSLENLVNGYVGGLLSERSGSLASGATARDKLALRTAGVGKLGWPFWRGIRINERSVSRSLFPVLGAKVAFGNLEANGLAAAWAVTN